MGSVLYCKRTGYIEATSQADGMKSPCDELAVLPYAGNTDKIDMANSVVVNGALRRATQLEKATFSAGKAPNEADQARRRDRAAMDHPVRQALLGVLADVVNGKVSAPVTLAELTTLAKSKVR
jgi:hypothetical protein